MCGCVGVKFLTHVSACVYMQFLTHVWAPKLALVVQDPVDKKICQVRAVDCTCRCVVDTHYTHTHTHTFPCVADTRCATHRRPNVCMCGLKCGGEGIITRCRRSRDGHWGHELGEMWTLTELPRDACVCPQTPTLCPLCMLVRGSGGSNGRWECADCCANARRQWLSDVGETLWAPHARWGGAESLVREERQRVGGGER